MIRSPGGSQKNLGRRKKRIFRLFSYSGTYLSEQELNSYRLTSIEEPTDEMLSAIMKEAAEEARKRGEEANKRFFEDLHQQGEEIRKAHKG